MFSSPNIRYLSCFILFSFYTFNALAAPSDYKVKDFGADPEARVLSTAAIQEAIEAAAMNGGGRVIISEGVYLSGSLILKSGVELHLEPHAVLLGSTNPRDYVKINSKLALILADQQKKIAISGKGTIDGQGRQLALNVDSLHHIGEMVDPNYNYRRMRPNESQRPELINMLKCENVRITGITMRNAASWVQTYEQCRYLIIDSVKVDSRAYWNNDGFDIVDCQNVRLTHCDVNSADDGICLKSHSADHMNDSVYIAHCTVRSSASAIKFGTASHGGFRNVRIRNIKVFDTFRSAIAIESVDGGIIDNIDVEGIIGINTGNALFIRLGHRSGEKPGKVRNVSLKDIYVQVPFGRPDIIYDMRGPEVDFFHNPFPVTISGIPGSRIEDVVLEDIEIRYPGRASRGMAYVPLSRLEQVPEQVDRYPEFSMFGELPAWGFYVRHVGNIHMKNIRLVLLDTDFRPAFVFDDVLNLKMEGVELPPGMRDQIFLHKVETCDLDPHL